MENLQKEFVTYQQALKLKELGFDEPCLFLYNSSDDEPKAFLANPPEPMDWNSLYVENTNKHLMSAPTFSQAFRWFRKKCSLYHKIDKQGYWFFEIKKDEGFGDLTEVIVSYDYNSYEEAELACLDKLLEICEFKN